ncbi:hypothetical protein KUTeg_010063 [Tegillarca granosa]|uniref:DUF7869 domain-containing protein n=1 Tax=Tegillarca granosa TaxID=220873 RepID=A0ABQ9FAP3_TEGGR|nr:hypothetical protein KUTeg_010063 [Tegillarca granosa]
MQMVLVYHSLLHPEVEIAFHQYTFLAMRHINQYTKDTYTRILSETTFRRIWHRCLPHIQFMTCRTDVYILQYYNLRCKAASRELATHPAVQGSVPPMSQNLIDVHYTFDFAQSFLLPSHCRQEGGLYFRSPYKAHMFGICNDGRSIQTNYIYGEDQCVGVDGKFSHSANSVISMLHHFFQTFGEGERICHMNADNCDGQNKNQIVTSYLAWRVANGLHEDIYLHFMKPYHSRCLVDRMFGLVRRHFCQTHNDCLEDLKTTIELSSLHNKSVLYSQNKWDWRDWKTYAKTTFKAIPGIQKYHHFHFSQTFPGMVKVKTSAQSEEKSIYILKRGKTISCVLPNSQEVGSLSSNRAWYSYHNIRPYVKDQKKNLLCPMPSIPLPKSSVTEE